MSRPVTGKGIGAPDFVKELRTIIYPVTSDSSSEFTGQLVQDAVERENLAGLRSNRIRISKVTIQSVQQLHFLLLIYSTDSFEEATMNDDKFVGSVEFDLTKYGIQQTTSQYRMTLETKIDYVDEDSTKELHTVIKNLSPTTKNGGDTGAVKLEFLCESRA